MGAAKKLQSGIGLQIRPPTASLYSRSLSAAGAAEAITVPSGVSVVIFSYSATPVFVSIGGTAVTPGDVTDGTGVVEINPTAYYVQPGDVISLQSPVAAIVCLAMYLTAGRTA